MNWRNPPPDSALGVVYGTVSGLVANRVPQMSAALAYYSALSLAPLVVITFAVTGLIVDGDLVQEHVVQQVSDALGPDGAALVRTLAQEQHASSAGLWASGVGLAMLVLGASAVFAQLQDGLNLIWGVRPGPKQGAIRYLRTRLVSMAMVFCLGVLLLASMLVNTIVSALGSGLDELVGASAGVSLALRLSSSFAVTTTLFALLFKWLPEARVTWREAWSGALLTSGLFLAGAWAIGQYVGHAAVVSAYGAAGSLVVLLVWVYFASIIVFTGAQFARAFATWTDARESEDASPEGEPD